jgi:hypothetical protein
MTIFRLWVAKFSVSLYDLVGANHLRSAVGSKLKLWAGFQKADSSMNWLAGRGRFLEDSGSGQTAVEQAAFPRLGMPHLPQKQHPRSFHFR